MSRAQLHRKQFGCSPSEYKIITPAIEIAG
jgi:hypothetical protein